MRLNFTAQLIAFATGIVLLTVSLSSVLVYIRAKAELEQAMANELLAIARSTASLVDADLVEFVYRNVDGSIEFQEEFDILREQLDRVRRLNGLPATGNPISATKLFNHPESSICAWPPGMSIH